MDQKTKRRTGSLFFFILLFVLISAVYADDDHKGGKDVYKINDGDNGYHHQQRKRERKGNGGHFKGAGRAAFNAVYQNACGACHFAYQPEFLPESSWMKLLADMGDHFGESVELDDESKKTIVAYLKTNSAENSRTKRGAKIIQSIRNPVPLRITQVPYIIKEHHEISPNVFKREAVGSLSNCTACHTTADDGVYDDDNVKIPE